MSFIPQNIKKFRMEKDLTQENVVRCLKDLGYDITTRTLSSWENGETSPNADTLASLSVIFNKPIEYFFVPVTYQTGAGN